VEADADGSAIERIVGEERAEAIHEAANNGHVEAVGAAAVEPPDRPCARRLIEGAQRDCAVGAAGQVDEIVLDITMPSEDEAGGA